MSISIWNRLLAGSAVAFALASCGGGGDIAAQNSTFGVSPGEVTLTVEGASESDCSGAIGDPGTTITIVGGVAPYRIHNSDPARVYVDKTEATGKDPTFNVRPTGYACGSIVITVLDYHSHTAALTYKLEGKKPETTP